MDDLLIRVLTRLLRVHEELGSDTYEKAARRALLAIASAVHGEAESKVQDMSTPQPGRNVVPFPLAKRLETQDVEN